MAFLPPYAFLTAASTTSFITGVMSTPMPSPSMNGTIGLSGVGCPGTTFVPPSGTRMGVVVLIRDGTLPGEARAIGEDHSLRPVTEVELVEDPRHALRDGGLVDRQPRGDVCVREPLRDEPQDLALAVVERRELGARRSLGRRPARELLDQPPRDRRREQSVSVRNG